MSYDKYMRGADGYSGEGEYDPPEPRWLTRYNQTRPSRAPQPPEPHLPDAYHFRPDAPAQAQTSQALGAVAMPQPSLQTEGMLY